MLFFKEAGPIFCGVHEGQSSPLGGRNRGQSAWTVTLCPQQPLGSDLLSPNPGLLEPVSVSRSLGITNEIGGRGLCAGFESWLCLLPAV